MMMSTVLHLQLQLRVSTSSWSDAFSLDTVGSYGCVRCPASNMDFLVRPQHLHTFCGGSASVVEQVVQ